MGRVALHVEQHFSGSESIRDVVIGMSDGLTVPFALAAGLAGAVSNHWLIVIGGLAEMAAGSIAMGMGGFLAARSDVDSYRAEMRREEREIEEVPEVEREEVRTIFREYGLVGWPWVSPTSSRDSSRALADESWAGWVAAEMGDISSMMSSRAPNRFGWSCT